MEFLKKLNKNDFLNHYWEQKPLVIKEAVKLNSKIIKSDELIEMACNDYFESRLVSFCDQKNDWDVLEGPFKANDFLNKDKNWTLINHNLNLYIANVAKMTKALNFLPAWLFDDAMSTYSTKGSSVGAHIDNYNVFIVQLEGTRKWDIQYNPNKEFQKDLPVRILEEFKSDESFILEPGDLIYIPPHVAHLGTSQSHSLSLSFGYKSLEDKKLCDQIASDLLNEFDSDDFYRTTFNKSNTDPNLIDAKNFENLETRILKLLKDKKIIQKSIVKFNSRTKREVEIDEEEILDFEEFCSMFKTSPLFKDEYIRFAAVQEEEDLFILSINEFTIELDQERYNLISSISSLTSEDAISYTVFAKVLNPLFSLYQQGFLFFDSDEK